MLRKVISRASHSLGMVGQCHRWMSSTPKWPPDPFPAPPPLAKYKHLSNIERKDQGYPCRYDDPILLEHELQARALMWTYNTTAFMEEQVELRPSILKDLLHPDSSEKIIVEPPFYVDYGYNITIGENTFINYDCILLDTAPIRIGFNCLLAPRVSIYTATHPLDPTARQEYSLAKPVQIGNNTWLGGSAVVCPGVTIGDGVVVAAGAVVTKDVPSFCVIGGNPAHIIKYLPGATKPETKH